MDKLMNMTVEELIELGYTVNLKKYDFEKEDEALSSFNSILSKGTVVRSTTVNSGSRWLSVVDSLGGLDLEIVHFLKSPKFVYNEGENELVL